MVDLEDLAALREELRLNRESILEARSFGAPEPAALTVKAFAERLGVVGSTVTNKIVSIEGTLGTYLVPRIDQGAPKIKRRKVRSNYPEDTRQYNAGPKPEGKENKSEIVLELTLDGEIWSLYADLVVRLHTLTKKATAPFPKSIAPVIPAGRSLARLGAGKTEAKPKPTRPSAASRAKYLTWLQHQHDLVTGAEAFLKANRYATPFHLDRFTPGYVPDPNEEPLWEPEDDL